MKKVNFLGIAAVALAITASAFTSPVKAHTKASGDYWFLISGSLSKSSPVPQADAMFLQQSITAPTEGSCTVYYGDVDHPVPGQIDHWVS